MKHNYLDYLDLKKNSFNVFENDLCHNTLGLNIPTNFWIYLKKTWLSPGKM